jgi:hypothetical protein
VRIRGKLPPLGVTLPVVLSGHNHMVARVAPPFAIWDTPFPPNVHFWFWSLVRVHSQQDQPPKPRCEASCRGLRGTGVVNCQCPQGTRQHPVVYMPSPVWGAAGGGHQLPNTCGTKMRTKNKKTDLWTQKKRGTLLQGDPCKKYCSRRLEAPVHREVTRLQPLHLLLRFQPRAGTNQWLDTCPR